jgi:hypothetical protein
MTAEEDIDEAAEEGIEDLEAPAESQSDVAGGAGPGCGTPSMVCVGNTCTWTDSHCAHMSGEITIYEQ